MKIELKVMDDDFVNRYDPNSHGNYACVEYSAMGAAWLHSLGKQPVFSVSMSNHDKSWGHTVCEVPMLGTYEDLSKITTAIAWDDNQKLDFIDRYYRYDANTYAHKYVWTINTIES